MKRIIAIILSIFFALATFTGCEKESMKFDSENQTTFLLSDICQMTEEEYNAYLIDLMNRTGIDVYSVSKLNSIGVVAQQCMQIYESFDEIPTRGSITQEKINRLQYLSDQMQIEEENGNDVAVMQYFEEFCDICSTIDGFVFNMNENGQETLTIDESQISVTLPVGYIEQQKIDAMNLVSEIKAEYPPFDDLSQNEQVEIIAASIFVRNSQVTPKGFSVSDCKKEAQRMLALSLSTATALYETGLLACAATTVGAGICVAVASASYGVSVGVAYYQYHRAIDNCNNNN